MATLTALAAGAKSPSRYKHPAQGHVALRGWSETWPTLWPLPKAQLRAGGKPASLFARHTGGGQPCSGAPFQQLCPAPTRGHAPWTGVRTEVWQRLPQLCAGLCWRRELRRLVGLVPAVAEELGGPSVQRVRGRKLGRTQMLHQQLPVGAGRWRLGPAVCGARSFAPSRQLGEAQGPAVNI